MKRLRIAIVGTRGIPANYGGFETCVDEVARRLAAAGEDVTVYCRRNNVGEAGTEYEGVRLRRLPSIYRKSLDTISHTLLSVLDGLFHGYDLYHVYGVGNAVFVPILKLFGRRVVISVDGLEWKRRKWGRFGRAWLRVSESIASRFADEIVADSKVVQAYYGDRYGRKTAYIPYGAYTTRRESTGHLEAVGLKPDGYILFVGRLIPEKGVHHLIRAFAGVRTDKRLVIVGDDPYNPEYVESLKRMAGDRVLFPGYAYGEAYEELCSHAYAYVQPSELEGTSPALLAAMGFGNCVVVNGIPENRETAGEAGLHYPVNDVGALGRLLQGLVDDPAAVETYRRRAVERVREVYNWDRIAEDTARLYRGEWGARPDVSAGG